MVHFRVSALSRAGGRDLARVGHLLEHGAGTACGPVQVVRYGLGGSRLRPQGAVQLVPGLMLLDLAGAAADDVAGRGAVGEYLARGILEPGVAFEGPAGVL